MMKTTLQTATEWCVAITLLSTATGLQGARQRPLPVPPPPDINSEDFQRQVSRQQSAALTKASRSRHIVKRKFIVGWEMHHGYFLIPQASPNRLAAPDFVDDRVRAQFDIEFRQKTLSTHVGQRLVCDCKGVAWSYYGSRFIVRAAKLAWVN